MTGQPSIQQHSILMDEVHSLTIQSLNNGIQNGFCWIRNINQFLLNIAGQGNAWGASWRATNISHVAINDLDATSHWAVRGMPIKTQYPCPSGKDCNIRVDETMANQSMVISCPNQTTNGVIPKCTFYCTATTTGCGTVQLFTTNSPAVSLFLDTASNAGFVLNADASGLKSQQKTINISCTVPYACQKSTFVVSGYDDASLLCEDDYSCEEAEFNISGFSNSAKILANAQSLTNAKLAFRSGSYLSVVSENTISVGQAFQSSHWSFHSIARIDFACTFENDCKNAIFESTHVTELAAICGTTENNARYTCFGAQFNNYENSSLTLQCKGDDSCIDVNVTYDGDEEYNTHCEIDCELSQQEFYHANCVNMTITVENNQRGYDALALFCKADQSYESCYGITVKCGESDYICSCPVQYDLDTG
ncbi:hypothetical protein RFI_08013 [Reticulomyxa filosa]|uniref:Uncharacterized protein n=1 Tax=Reticulomyxa filosa TaxID=46433 RepID=X6NT26_RETFI|nr:hypothetical protein RFI_08013 [Reticulomyxa filosa]|eukprot:ETO29113.1 hypothetical protein RFI_08013 [Reticulomyxa filosa]